MVRHKEMMKKIGIIIQARGNSSRLKGKIFKKLDKRTLIEWVVQRVKKSKTDLVILATSKKNEDKKLKKICDSEKIEFFQGSEHNVLERFYKAAVKFKLDAIVRVCADNPFVDYQEINILIDSFKKNKSYNDYYFNHRNYNNFTYADGFGAELITFQALKKIHKSINKKSDKEHVTSYIWNNLNIFRINPCKTKINKNYHHVILDINKIDDYKKIKRFIKIDNIKTNNSANKIASLYSLHEIKCYLFDLFNINRSLAGEENRKTLNYLKKNIPIKIKGIKSGLNVFGWSIPKEWKLKEGYISDHTGKKLIDFKKNNLHVASYSQPVKTKLSFTELEKKIFTHKIYEAIPYRTLYYKNDWAFCSSKKDLKKIKNISKKNKNKKLNICIDSFFKNGKMNYGEILIPGRSKKEVLISTYICHPSMANDNLSGIVLTSLLINYIKNVHNLKWSYRIIFIPETIGSISYIKKNVKKLRQIDFGINISCVGGKGKFSFKETWDCNHFLNKLVEDIFRKKKIKYKKFKFDIHGSDERQYSYAGSAINTISIHKDKFYEYKEYHTSLDNLSFVKNHQIFKSFLIYKELINQIEKQDIYKSYYQYSEPMLSKYKLYPQTGGSLLPNNKKLNNDLDNILWILFMCDGKRTLDEIKNKLNLKKENLLDLVSRLLEKKLIHHV
jgi:aminopeptidase-like protein/GTP:adenosylcobinamide-phosphate guanylyltransferase